jgi:excinuclease ABC subunit A
VSAESTSEGSIGERQIAESALPATLLPDPATGRARGERACVIQGARTHNLKSISCRIPFARLTAITGVSGSGKSTLAFDVLYAEGQRRFVDCLSTYARQFLQRLDRPEADFIGEIQPPVALHQHTAIRNARSTVGSITEMSDLLQLLFAHGGTPHCPDCGIPMHEETVASAVSALKDLPQGRYVLVVPLARNSSATPFSKSPSKKKAVKKRPRGLAARSGRAVSGGGQAEPLAFNLRIRALQEQGYTRIYQGGEVREWIPGHGTEEPLLVLDRFEPSTLRSTRAHEAIEAAWRIDPTQAKVYRIGESTPSRLLRRGVSCTRCLRSWEPLRPRHFSADSPLGACPSCHGFGRLVIVDRDKVVPDPRRTVREGAITPFNTQTGAMFRRRLLEQAKLDEVPLDIPYRELSPVQQDWIFMGNGRYRGVEGLFKKLERKRYRTHVRVFLARYRGYVPCSECRASRLRPEALAVRVGAHDLAQMQSLPVRDLASELGRLELAPDRRPRVAAVLAEIRERLGYLEDVGLGYLTLARTARTLSGGETQRIRLASGLGTALTGTLYILDEPTVGLHESDTARMLSILYRLRDAGNTVVVVEHDPGIIRGTDHLIVLGPSGGEDGGEILYEGPTERFFREEPSFFRVEECDAGSAATRTSSGAASPRSNADELAPRSQDMDVDPRSNLAILLEGIRHHNLDIDELIVPADRLVVVTGVSGSGKSTLVDDVLFRNAQRQAGIAVEEVGTVRVLKGLERFSEVLLVAQNPLGRSSRSNILTYTGLLGIVRKLLAQTPRAKSLRLSAGAFSFNVAGGRCEECKGMGTVTIEMHFLADVEVTCDACRGRRFREPVIEVSYRGKSILQLLDLTVAEACAFFADRADVQRLLAPLVRIGLGYLRLGQSTSTLSGGEAQRLKIASLLADKSSWTKPGLFLLDEPTTGLHPRDIGRLLGALRDLIRRGHGVIVVEHQLDFIRAADHVIDLGPGGGDTGGRLLYSGPLAGLASIRESPTARALGGDRIKVPWLDPWPCA